MSDTAPAWVTPVMRAGYGARAATYLIVGALACLAAWTGGAAQGTTDALADLKGHLWGLAALWAIALGLFAYTLWRLVDAWMDLDDYGHGIKGVIARAGLVTTGLIHGALGLSAASLALGGAQGQGGAQSLTQKLMTLPQGPLIVGLIGLATLGAGAYYIWKGVAEKYKDHIRVTPMTERLDPILKAGCLAEGVMIGIIGLLILFAALTTDASEAGGVGEALQQIRAVTFGRILLGVIGLGLIGFAVENLVEAIYRVIPRCAGPDVMTFARRARQKARDKLRAATA
ncbi:DUF1206 domain-containing protein [Antarctobacter jejuensis]|uniref:DUF1206 domain-containing protein n=1 Tax=Antarctobacter jejuensis TaxID=1439938 RepID=UPI003FD01CEF